METVIRVAVIYIVIIAGLRIMGKREFSQLSSAELVALLLIPELVSQSLIREDFSATNGLIALTTLFALVFLNSLFTFHSKTFSKLITGAPTVLVAHGKLQHQLMSKERVSVDEIFDQIHKSGMERLEEVKWAILESDGRISVVPVHKKPVAEARTEEMQVQ